jgi:hypothetical protein
MLAPLTRKWRWRAACLLVAAYSLCLIMPTAVLALSDTPGAAHCLTDDHHGIATFHVHQDGSSHHHDSNGGDEPPGKCCGLFCLSAVSPDVVLIGEPQVHAAAVIVSLTARMAGRRSDRIDRPPRSPLSL